jgi:hypothetical protein
MQSNPFSPPKSLLADIQYSPVPRPKSVWLVLLILLVITVTFAIATARFVWFFTHLANEPKFQFLAIGILWRLTIEAALLAVMIGIFHRRQWGRWSGALAIVALAVLCFLAPDTTEYLNDAERTGGMFARNFLMPLLLFLWTYRFGFSSKARRYFSIAQSPNQNQGNPS